MNKSDAELHIERIAYSIEEAAAALGVASDGVRAQVRAGQLPHVVFGTERVLIGKRALEDWLTRACMANLQGAAASEADLAQLPVRTADAVRKFRSATTTVDSLELTAPPRRSRRK